MNKIAILAMLLLLTACGPSTYEDCILQNMDDKGSDVAALSVIKACRAKFPNEPIAAKEVATEAAGEAAAASGVEISASGQYPQNEKVIGLESELTQKKSANNDSDKEWLTDENGNKYKIIGYEEIEPSAK